MMKVLRLTTLIVSFVIFLTHSVRPTTNSENETGEEESWAEVLEFEYLTPVVISAGLDGNPKLRLKITNTGDEALNDIQFRFLPNDSPSNFSGCATFPNGGFVNLEPGESTIISVWSNCYFGDGLELPEGTSNHVANFILTKDLVPFTYIQEFQIINDRTRDSPAAASGENMTIAGTVRIDGGYMPMVDLAVKTVQSVEFNLDMQPAGEGVFAFSFPAEVRDDWHLVIRVNEMDIQGVNFPVTTLAVADFEDPENIDVTISSLDYEYNVDFELTHAITTPTGFWRGAVSESEETIAFFPGQENWAEGNGKSVEEHKANSTIFKYGFDGTKLWEYKTGWQTWGGDMSPDGSRVVYQLVPNGGTYSVGVLNGLTGELIWKKEFFEFSPEARALEGLEASLSNDAQLVAVGTVPTGVVTIIDSNTGDFLSQFPNAPDQGENWGQIRMLKFDENDEFLYVGSGDNYLRKVRVSDGEVMWRAFIGGWPFVNGLKFSSDGTFAITGTKSFDQARVNLETGETEWINDTGSLEAALSSDDQYVMNFGGMLMDATTGAYLAFFRQGAESHFFSNDELVAKMDRNIAVSYRNSRRLHDSAPSGGGQGGGEQSQWSYMSADGSLAVIAYRDFVSDPGNQIGIAFYSGTIERIALDPNNSPTDISLSASTIAENNEEGAAIGDLSTNDPDANDSHSYELVEGEGDDDNASFGISDGALVATNVLDFEEKASYSVRVQSEDETGARIQKTFIITVTDANDAPSAVEIDNSDVNENSDAGTTVGNLSTEDDDTGDTHSYSLVSGTGDTDNTSFTLEGAMLKTAASLDFETQSSYSVLVRTDDGNGGTFDQQLTISANDVNEAPTDLSLSNSSILEGQDAGTEVGTFSATDEDTGDSFSYAFVTGDGDSDNGDFEIDGSTLKAATSFTFATKSEYSIRIEVTDSGGEKLAKSFTITVEEDVVTALEPDPELIDKLYPNPSSDFVNIDLATESYPFDVKMFDFSGNLKVHESAIFQNSVRLDLRQMPRGVYLVMVKDNSGGITRKKILVGN